MTKIRSLSRVLPLMAALAPAALVAQPKPVGNEFQVNSYTTGRQRAPSVAARSDGEFVVVWISNEDILDNYTEVQLRRFDGEGAPLGEELQVNTAVDVVLLEPAVSAPLAGGEFMVVWTQDNFPSTYSSDVIGRAVASDGTPVGSEIAISPTLDYASVPAIGASPGNEFIVVWDQVDSVDGGPSARILGRRFMADGTAIGSSFIVNDEDGAPAIAVEATGEFLVVWDDPTPAGDDNDAASVQGRRFMPDGTPQGPIFQVNTYTTGSQRYAGVAMTPQGEFLVVWVDRPALPDSPAIRGRGFAADGTPFGPDFQINTSVPDADRSRRPTVASVPPDGFLVSWSSDDPANNDPEAVMGRWVTSSGQPVGQPFQVNTYTTGRQHQQKVAATEEGELLVVWASDGSSGDDNDLDSVQAQRYVNATIFTDGFESGDTSAWQ